MPGPDPDKFEDEEDGKEEDGKEEDTPIEVKKDKTRSGSSSTPTHPQHPPNPMAGPGGF
jgi:hypothetical protein